MLNLWTWNYNQGKDIQKDWARLRKVWPYCVLLTFDDVLRCWDDLCAVCEMWDISKWSVAAGHVECEGRDRGYRKHIIGCLRNHFWVTWGAIKPVSVSSLVWSRWVRRKWNAGCSVWWMMIQISSQLSKVHGQDKHCPALYHTIGLCHTPYNPTT